ncbi:Rpn family recombination-promoting nuclease/putative transposase [Nocardia camponoti]|uniref:Transposase (putative) YhgA-like domain-containing protein n=1 Tax=Nocardia camponoti TaxID=1616106 RepID=A0A917QAS1_9NOCA|nr:Rpn family recombination-promoting nuclease/putative transposase [Nocardia camponoti]GGK40480.1 hypothetical protein GCM10011591_10140 [Nocardia camponoti]
MGDSVHHPHDSVVKHTLSNPATAAAHARPLVEAVAPLLAKAIDWSSLQRQSTAYISRVLDNTDGDLLFRVSLYTGETGYLYFAHEHQSSNDLLMAFRVMEYQVAAVRQHLREHSKPKPTTIPFVITIVSYAGSEKWTAVTDVADLVAISPELREEVEPFLPHLRYVLDDISATPLADLYAHTSNAPALILRVLLKVAAKHEHLVIDLEPLLVAFAQLSTDELIGFVRYIQDVSETDDDELRTFFVRVGPEAEEAFMTTANRLVAKGEAKAQVRTLLRLITLKFGEVPPFMREAIGAADVARLDEWFDRAVTAQSLDDLGIA